MTSMPDDQTDIITKSTVPEPELNGSTSHIMSVSLRGWLAMAMVGTLCALALWLRTDKIIESFVLLCGGAISFYFGQSGKK